MPLDDHPDDDRPPANGPLPPEDRLWRHPSELSSSSAPPDTWFAAPEPEPAGPRRSTRAALVGACLTGAAIALGVMWVARPTRVVERTIPAERARTTEVQTASYTINPAPTERLAEDLATDLAPIRVLHDGAWSAGSGVWLATPGALVAAAPLVADAERILVTDGSGRSRAGTLRGTDPATGIAVITVAGADDRSTLTERTAPARGGGTCAVVGATDVEAGAATGRATIAGVIIRATSLRATLDDLVLQESIQLDRPVPADAGGGALVDAKGRFVGLVVGNSSDRYLGTAVPAATVDEVAADLLDDGAVRRAWLGVQAGDLDPAAAAALGVPGGARITEVTPASPAATAGIRAGDIVTAVDDEPVDDASDLVVLLRAADPGDEVTVTVTDDAGSVDRRVSLGG